MSADSSLGRVAAVVNASADLVAHVLGNVGRLVADATSDSVRVAEESQALYGAAMERAGDVQAAVRAAPRFTRVVAEAARLVALYRLRGPSPALHRDAAERIYQLCVELRGGVLKLGQFASSRMDLLPPAYVEALGRLQDRVPPVPAAGIRARVEEELGRPIADAFAGFDDEPLAAASLAQVHAATLPDGTAVAVKVQVPGIDQVVETDLVALRVVAPLVAELLPRMDLATFVDELSRAVREELDYRAEATHAEAFAADFAGDPGVVVPGVVRALSTGRVLVLERIDGERITDWLDAREADGEDGAPARDRLFEILVRSYCAQILRHGRFQADAHPGNFLVAPGPSLALLDFGCVQEFAPEARRAWAGLAGAILANDAERMAAGLVALGFSTRDGDPGPLRELAQMIMEAFRGRDALAAIDPRAQLERALEIARANPVVRVPRQFVLLGRVLASLGGLLMRYRPRLDLMPMIAPYLLG